MCWYRTSSNNTVTNTVCANVSSLSQFVVAVEGIRPGQIIYNRFAANANVDGTIWAVYPNGTGDHQITTGSYPRLSPNGNYLAFKRKRTATTNSSLNYGLWVMNLTTGAETEIFYQGDYLVGFDFTPDSSKVVFDYFCVVYQINIDGSGLQPLINTNCFDDAPAVSPIGGMLAFHSTGGIIYTSNANGSNKQQVPNTGGDNYYTSWSKDGQFIAYLHYDGSSPDPYNRDSLYKIKPDGTGKVLLKTLTGADRFAFNTGTWSIDGTQIYISARIGGVTGIYAVATDGSGTISLTPESANIIAAGANVELVGGINGSVTTAANAAVSGRVTVGKNGLSNINVTISGGSLPHTLSIKTNSFGNYKFDNLPTGETYILTVSAKKYMFTTPTRIVNLNEDVTDADFTAEDQ